MTSYAQSSLIKVTINSGEIYESDDTTQQDKTGATLCVPCQLEKKRLGV